MTPDQFKRILHRNEWPDTEFKGEERSSASDDEPVETIACLANRSSLASAWLFIGVDFVRGWQVSNYAHSVANYSRAINYSFVQKIIDPHKSIISMLINMGTYTETVPAYQITTDANITALLLYLDLINAKKPGDYENGGYENVILYNKLEHNLTINRQGISAP